MGHVHAVVCADDLLLALDHALALGVLRNHGVALPVGPHVVVEDLKLARAVLVDVRLSLLQVLLHDRRVRALRKLPTFLDSTVSEDALTAEAAKLVTGLLLLGLPGHLELFEWRLGELFFDFLLEVDELELDFRVDVPPPFQRPARQRNDVALGGALFAAHVLLAIRDALAHAVHVVGLGKPMLSVSSARIVGVDLALLHFLRPLLTACVSTVGMPAADLGRRCQFRRLVSTR